MTTDVKNFQFEVIERSYEKPVLVDFWAPWCGPCRMLGPVLEKLSQEESASWELAKVNTDEQQDVARRYSIASIPAVKLFSRGEVVDEFVGAIPEPSVRKWLAAALPAGSQPAIEQARASLTDNPEEAVKLLNTVIGKEPGNATARALVAQAIVFQDPHKALEMLEGADLSDAGPYQVADAVGTLAHLATLRSTPASLGDEPGKDIYLEAARRVAELDFGGAFEQLLSVVQRNRALDGDGARRAMLALFTLLGEEHELTPVYRLKLQRALF